MELKDAVSNFLKDFKYKLDFLGLLFRSDRKKNFRTMLELEISVNDIKKILRELTVKDYSEGPLEDTLYKVSDIWVFGKIVKKRKSILKSPWDYLAIKWYAFPFILPKIK